MMSSTEIKVFAGRSNPELAKRIAEELGVELGKIDYKVFANDNLKVRIDETVRGKDVFFIQTSTPPVAEMLVETLITLDALKHASAGRVTAVIPYFPYVRSDKKDEPRISITAKLMAKLLETAGADRVLTMNLHAPQIQGFFNMPSDQLLARKLVIDYFQTKDLSNAVVVAPDAGSAKMAGGYAKRMHLPLAIMDKRRSDHNDRAEIFHVIGDVKGKDALIFDDEVATAGSMIEAEKALRNMGALSIRAFAVHAVLAGPAVERLSNSSMDEFVTTNTLPISDDKKWDKLTILDVAPVFAKAIKNINSGTSITGLFC